MSNEAATIKRYEYNLGACKALNTLYLKRINKLKEKIEVLEGGSGKWKSVAEDGYPEFNVGVLVFIPEEDNHITSGMWDISNKWVLLDEYREPDVPVTHWMQLPKPPAQ